MSTLDPIARVRARNRRELERDSFDLVMKEEREPELEFDFDSFLLDEPEEFANGHNLS